MSHSEPGEPGWTILGFCFFIDHLYTHIWAPYGPVCDCLFKHIFIALIVARCGLYSSHRKCFHIRIDEDGYLRVIGQKTEGLRIVKSSKIPTNKFRHWFPPGVHQPRAAATTHGHEGVVICVIKSNRFQLLEHGYPARHDWWVVFVYQIWILHFNCGD